VAESAAEEALTEEAETSKKAGEAEDAVGRATDDEVADQKSTLEKSQESLQEVVLMQQHQQQSLNEDACEVDACAVCSGTGMLLDALCPLCGEEAADQEIEHHSCDEGAEEDGFESADEGAEKDGNDLAEEDGDEEGGEDSDDSD